MPGMNIRTHPRGAPPDYWIQYAPNANETRAQQWFIEQLLKLEDGTVNGGGYTHKPGYHDTVKHNDARSGVGGDYSNRDAKDRRGNLNVTRARDWTFRKATAEETYRAMAKYGARIRKSWLDPNDPRLNGWREYLGQTDSDQTAEGIDFRYNYERQPDPSHEWHGHFSEDTEQVESFDNKWAMLTVLADWTVEEWRRSLKDGGEDMSFETDQVPVSGYGVDPKNPTWTGPNALGDARNHAANANWLLQSQVIPTVTRLEKAVTDGMRALGAAITAVAAQDAVDEVKLARELATGVAAAVLASLPAGQAGVTQEELAGAIKDVIRHMVGSS